MTARIHVIFTLSKNMNTEKTLYRIRKGWIIDFQPDSSLAGHSIRFFTNYPLTQNDYFKRDQYREVEVEQPRTRGSNDQSDRFFQVVTHQSGAFQFHFCLDNSLEHSGCGYFLVDPRFCHTDGQKSRSFELDGIVAQTYLPKSLGEFSTWKSKLEVSRKSNYNMIHFTPLQELGISDSAYSLRDQLKLNPTLKTDWKRLEELISFMEHEWGILSMADLVFNHTAIDSPWIREHPECGFTLNNSPHMRTAYIVDRIVWNLTCKVAGKRLQHLGLSDVITEESHLNPLREELWRDLNAAHIHEYHLCHVDRVVDAFRDYVKCHERDIPSWNDTPAPLHLVLSEYTRHGATVNMRDAVLTFYKPQMGNHHDALSSACHQLRECLEGMNRWESEVFRGHLDAAVNATMGNIRWRFIQHEGPRTHRVTLKEPLMWSYFFQLDGGQDAEMTLQEMEQRIATQGDRIMACNGWIMNDTPTRNFAEDTCHAYLRRDIVIWGDCIKLRYGATEADCPYLWQRMREYTEQTARVFHAVRLDNCHSTPLHVLQWLLDKARAVRNDLYIVAELFTGSAELDNLFMNKLGINSLIREAQAVNTAFDFGAMLLRYGGSPVGSFIQPTERILFPSAAHALFYDCTHDNPSPITKHCALDVLPTAALTSMAVCAVGSNRGYDEMVPHYIDVVKENRPYRAWNDTSKDEATVGHSCGIIQAKSVLNSLHEMMARENYFEIYVDQVDGDIVSVTRQCPFNRHSVILFAHTVFHVPGSTQHRGVRSVELPGCVTGVLLEATHTIAEGVGLQQLVKEFATRSDCINGLSSERISIKMRDGNFPARESKMFSVENLGDHQDGRQRLHFHNFPPGAVLVLAVTLGGRAKGAIDVLDHLMQTELQHRVRAASSGPIRIYIPALIPNGEANGGHPPSPKSPNLDEDVSLAEVLSELTLVDLNYLLFRCKSEERTDRQGAGTYNVPNFGTFVYCGLQSIVFYFDEIRPRNDLGHPLCGHIREGDWLMQYTVNRLTAHSSRRVKLVGEKLNKFFENVSHLPGYLKPCYLDAILSGAYAMIVREMMSRFPEDVSQYGSLLRQTLCANSVIFCGHVSNSQLPPLHPDVLNSLPDWMKADAPKGDFRMFTIAAGLPHFSEGLFRAWGRDTFIAFRGLLLLTGRFEEARCLLLSYSALLRHGLMPNLLGNWDSKKRSMGPRYNCRDAVWWWLYCVREYCRSTDDKRGDFLQEKVLRLFPVEWERRVQEQYKNDPDWLRCPRDLKGETCTVGQLVVEALARHCQGIDFTEWGAGSRLDEHMTPEGFHVTASIMRLSSGPPTGFPTGGNPSNCGTWMDKMGSSDKAGNRGKPATSRDGAPVELAGLCSAVVDWLAELHAQGHLKVAGVGGQGPTWAAWSKAMRTHFEALFWIPSDAGFNAGLYKDMVGSALRWPDMHFRPNFLITMAVAPDLFQVERAWFALQKAREDLLGPLGMRTLAKYDLQYRGNYHNDDDSTEYTTAKGLNYHQGPEWLWPVGYYLRAYLLFGKRVAKSRQQPHIAEEAMAHAREVMARLTDAMSSSPWLSLPELTNADGAHCPDSCPAQAWSVGCLHEALFDLLHFSNLN